VARESAGLWSSYPLRRARLAVRILTFAAPFLLLVLLVLLGVKACAPDTPAEAKAARTLPTSRTAADRPAGPAADRIETAPPEALLMPVVGVEPAQLRDNFDETRGGSRSHEAIDILAPRDTPVVAVADGRVAKLWKSVPGGITLYQFDVGGNYCYYYAHLERYARGIEEGASLRRGEVIGYVGTSGNAPRDTPHLHFAIYRLGPDRRWWEGEPMNPFPLLGGGTTSGRD
jgi:peptidoglycan LD-endopeptidase LytH